MDHGPAVELDEDLASEIKSRLGVKLFWVYTAVYCGFIAINIIDQELMEKTIFWGLNLAVVYGMGLIVLAIVMGVIYNHICTGYENKLNPRRDVGGQAS